MNIGELFVTLGAKIDDKFNNESSAFIGKIGKTKDSVAALQKSTAGQALLGGMSTETVNLNDLFENLVVAINLVRVAIVEGANALGKFAGATENIMDVDWEGQEEHIRKQLFYNKLFTEQTEKTTDKTEDLGKETDKTSKSIFKSSNEFKGIIGFLNRFISTANLARLGVLAMGTALTKLVLNAADASEHLFKFSINTGMDTTSLQMWQQQAGAAGIQAEEVAGSFKELQQKSLEIQLGQNEGAAQAFRLSGVDWTGDAETMMKQAQTMLKNRPAALGTKLAMDMGLSEEMVTFLRLRDGLKPPDENLILSKEEIADLKDFNIGFTSSILSMKMAMIKLGAIVSPLLKPIFALFGRIALATGEFTKWLSGLGKWKGYILGIAAAIATAVTAFFFPVTSTVLLIAAAVAGVGLLIDDVATFMRGGDSLTGRIINGWKQALDDFMNWFSENWVYLIGYLGDEAKNLGEIFYTFFADIFNWIGENWKYLIGYMGDEASNIWEGVKDFFGFGDKHKKDLQAARNESGQPQNTPMTPMFSAPRSANNTASTANNAVNQNININVSGAGDPKAVGNEVAARMKQQTNHALFQLPRSE